MIKAIFELQNPWRANPNYPFNRKRRKILDILIQNLKNSKIIGLTGSRQVGKSSLILLLIEHLINEEGVSPTRIYYFNLDDIHLHSLFSNISKWIDFVGKAEKEKKYIFIDEIQRLNAPGLFLKELYDLRFDYKIIFSGSSQLEMKSKVKEHLTGRVRLFEINRLSFNEYLDFNTPISREEALEEMLIYGSYPEVALERSPLEKKLLIKDIFQMYIEKDLMDLLKIDNIDVFNKLVKLLAAQTGNLLNIQNISNRLRIGRSVIEKYLQVLEKTYIIKLIYPFYRNYPKEIIKTPKIYFLDLGLRNFALNRFESVDFREDTGHLFENFYFLELLNEDYYGLRRINFWRTANGTEIDFIVHDESGPVAIETKWSAKSNPKSFQFFQQRYPDFSTKLVTRERYVE